MIYECPQCGKPQRAGETVCPQCRSVFDGPVPADALVPEDMLAEEARTEEARTEKAPAGMQQAKEVPAAASPGPMPLDPPAVLPPAEDPPAAARPAAGAPPPVSGGTEPYLTPPGYAPPPYEAEPHGPGVSYPAPAPLGGLPRWAVIAVPLVLLILLGGVYLAGTLSSGSDAAPAPAVPQRAEAPATLPPPAPTGPPTLLQGGSNSNNSSDPRVKVLTGRWTAKNDTYFVFSANGSGARGSTTNPGGEQSFLWGLVQNRLMLYGSKNETLRFSPGPDNDTVYLGPPTGRAIQFSRAKTP